MAKQPLKSITYDTGLLDSFQTWIGVLASLLVLCIAVGNNNLHSQLLKTTKDRIDRSVNEARQLLLSYITSCQREDSMRTVNYERVSRIRTKIKLLNAERQQVISLRLANKPTIEDERSKILKCIEERLITVTAPFYSLISCILLFILDGILILGWIRENLIMTFLFILLVVSIAYWIVLWIKDYRYVCHIINSGTISLKDKRNKHWINLLDGILALIIMVIFVAFASHPEINVTIRRWLVFGFGLGAGFVVSSLPMAIRSLKGTNLPYGHTFLHSLIFIVYCGMATWILTGSFIWSKSTASILFVYKSTHTLIFIWSLFILVNGLIIPFVMNQFAYKKIGDTAMAHYEMQKVKLDQELKNIDIRLKILQELEDIFK